MILISPKKYSSRETIPLNREISLNQLMSCGHFSPKQRLYVDMSRFLGSLTGSSLKKETTLYRIQCTVYNIMYRQILCILYPDPLLFVRIWILFQILLLTSKKFRKTLISTVLLLLNNLISLKTAVNAPTVFQKKLDKTLILLAS